jgi:hypothetical protein
MGWPAAASLMSSGGGGGGMMSSMPKPFSPNVFGSGIGALIGDYTAKNPYDSMSQYMDKIQPMMEKYMNPYMQAGQGAMSNLQGQYANLMKDPGAMMKQFGAGFQADPGYQFSVDQATKAANQASAAGGMVGSPAEQQQLAGTVSGLANQQYQQYLQNAMGMYGQGLQGMQGINQMGYGASSDMANQLSNLYLNQAQQAQRSSDWSNQQKGGEWGGIGSLVGSMFSLTS